MNRQKYRVDGSCRCDRKDRKLSVSGGRLGGCRCPAYPLDTVVSVGTIDMQPQRAKDLFGISVFLVAVEEVGASMGEVVELGEEAVNVAVQRAGYTQKPGVFDACFP
jgi:hypothetical protein